MDTLKQRAWMQAQREIEMNVKIITKPDSVLKLTCFDEFLDNASGNYIFASDDVPPEDVLAIPLVSAFGQISNGFQLDLVGGTTDLDADMDTEEPAGNFSGCAHMEEVWRTVQCENIDSDTHFPSLRDFVTDEDTRREPGHPLQCAALPMDNRDGWEAALDSMETKDVGADNYFDEVRLFRDKWAPHSGEISCSDGLPTGVMVNPSGSTQFPEKICPNPGCYFTGGTSGNCEPI